MLRKQRGTRSRNYRFESWWGKGMRRLACRGAVLLGLTTELLGKVAVRIRIGATECGSNRFVSWSRSVLQPHS